MGANHQKRSEQECNDVNLTWLVLGATIIAATLIAFLHAVNHEVDFSRSRLRPWKPPSVHANIERLKFEVNTKDSSRLQQPTNLIEEQSDLSGEGELELFVWSGEYSDADIDEMRTSNQHPPYTAQIGTITWLKILNIPETSNKDARYEWEIYRRERGNSVTVPVDHSNSYLARTVLPVAPAIYVVKVTVTLPSGIIRTQSTRLLAHSDLSERL